MKVLLINGSPNPNGCTNRALVEVANSLNQENIETEIIHIGNKAISGCIACGKCKTSGKCVFNDIVNDLVAKAKESDGFIFGSPVYYASINGSMISILDRFFRCSKSLAYKPGAGIVSARRAGTTASLDIFNKYFTFSQMPIISSNYWNMVHGNNREEVEKDLEGLQIMRTLGKNMAYFLKCIEAGKRANITEPVVEQKINTNFIR